MRTIHRPKLLVLTQHYHPEAGFITQDVASAMATFADVVVVTAQPNYPYGKIFRGHFHALPKRDVERSGVVVWRLPVLADHSTSKIRRLVSYLSFSVAAAIFAPFVAGRPTTVWVYQTPFTTALAALWFRYVMRSRIVFTIVDLWPESLIAAGLIRQGHLERCLRWFSHTLNRAADFVACSTVGTAARMEADGIPPDHLAFVPVWVQGIPEPLPPTRRSLSPAIVYIGNVGPLQGLDVVIRAAALLTEQGTPIPFHIYGDGTALASLKALAQSINAPNVIFASRLEPSEAFAVASSATAQIVCLRPSVQLAATVPSKLFFAMAAGTPILAGLGGESAQLALAAGGAIPFSSDNPAELVIAAIRAVALTPSDRASMLAAQQRHYIEHFSRTQLLLRYRTFLFAEKHLNDTRGRSVR